jgi:hypothetical protein
MKIFLLLLLLSLLLLFHFEAFFLFIQVDE